MDFEKICMMFTMQEPFYGIILSSMDRQAAPHITKTMAVGMSGNVFRLYYNPDFVNKIDVETTLQLLKHEVLHCAFSHFTIFEDKTTDPHERYIRNIACDMEVNGYLDKNKVKIKIVWPEEHGFKRFLGTKEYYRNLKQQEQQQQQQAMAEQPQQQCNGGQGGQGMSDQNDANQQPDVNDGNDGSDGNDGNSSKKANENKKPSRKELEKAFEDQFKSFDEHDKWPDDFTEAEAEQVKQMVDTMLAFAAEECEKSQGHIPDELVGRIEKIKKKPKPVCDWKQKFRRYLGNEFTDILKKSKKRESKRFPDAAGTRHRKKSRILIGIDTSGSVSMPEYREFFGQIKTMIDTTDFHVMECDSRIQYEYDFKGKISETLHGGGGTEFYPVIDYFIEHRKEYEALVYFTDGYCSIPKNTPKDTLWVVSSQGDHNRKKYMVNGASVVFIPEKQ